MKEAALLWVAPKLLLVAIASPAFVPNCQRVTVELGESKISSLPSPSKSVATISLAGPEGRRHPKNPQGCWQALHLKHASAALRSVHTIYQVQSRNRDSEPDSWGKHTSAKLVVCRVLPKVIAQRAPKQHLSAPIILDAGLSPPLDRASKNTKPTVSSLKMPKR